MHMTKNLIKIKKILPLKNHHQNTEHLKFIRLKTGI
jgi:hypothetical protein